MSKDTELDLSSFDEEDNMSVSEDEEMSPQLKQLLGVGTGTAIGKGLEKGANAMSKPLSNLAEDMAYKSVGGTSTPTGKKFLKSELENIGRTSSPITTRSLGRRALDEGYADVFKGTGTAFEEVEDKMLESIANKKDILSNIDAPVNLEEVGLDMYKNASKDIDLALGGKNAEDTLLKLQKDMEYLQGQRSLSDVEKAKVDVQNRLKYEPGVEAISRPTQKIERVKAKALKDAVESGVEAQGDEVLQEFLKSKTDTGERGIIRNMLLDKNVRESVSPEISIKDIGMTGVGGPGLAAGNKVLQKKGASMVAKTSDLLSKLAKSKAMKALPFVGAGIGGLATYSEARAAGEDVPDSIGKAVTSEGLESVLGLGSLVLPDSTGPNKKSLEWRLENGEKLNAQEYRELSNKNPAIAESMLNNPNPTIQNFGEQLMSKEKSNSELFQLQQSPAFREIMRRETKKMSLESDGAEQTRGPASMIEGDVLDKVKSSLAERESSNNPKAINDLGYVGKYQFGAAALEDLGYLKKGSYKAHKNKAMNMPELWTQRDGMGNLETFLSSEGIQDSAVSDYMKINYKRLKNKGIDVENLPPEEVAGLLSSAHLVGHGGASDFYKGKDSEDAFGTKASEYYELGKGAATEAVGEGNSRDFNKEATEAAEQNNIDYNRDATEIPEEAYREVDRVLQQQSSGDMSPISQLDSLLEKINNMSISQDDKDTLEDEAIAMEGHSDGNRLKEMIRKLNGLS